MTWGWTLQAWHLTMALVFLLLWRQCIRRALLKGCREAVEETCRAKLVAKFIIFASQWWTILGVVLVIELAATTHTNFQLAPQMHHWGFENREWLGRLCMGVFPAAGVTYLLVMIAIILQLRAAWKAAAAAGKTGAGRWQRGEVWVLTHARDVAIQVLFMPAVYHLMMCRTVMRQWNAVAGVHVDEWNYIPGINEATKAELDNQAAEADTNVAEMFDAYALWCFGSLAMTFVEEKMALAQPKMVAVLRTTTLLGVFVYVLTATASAFYNIALICLKVWWTPDSCSNQPSDPSIFRGVNATDHAMLFFQAGSGFCVLQNQVYGANMATSTIAIYNLVYFEVTLHEEIQEFRPQLKFWSMKLPITLAFSVSLLKLLQPLTNLDSVEVDILNACVKAYCMTFTALLNIFAWKASEEWYNKERLRDDLQWSHNNIDPMDYTDSETDETADSIDQARSGRSGRQTPSGSPEQTWARDPWGRANRADRPGESVDEDSSTDDHHEAG